MTNTQIILLQLVANLMLIWWVWKLSGSLNKTVAEYTEFLRSATYQIEMRDRYIERLRKNQ